MNKIRIIFYSFAILLGTLMFVYGGYDDSPGGQLLGVIAVVIGIRGIIKTKKKISIYKSYSNINKLFFLI